MVQMHKDVTVGETQYQVGRMKAHEGSWIMSVLRSKQIAALSQRAIDPVPEQETPDAAKPSFEEGLMATTGFLMGQFTFEETKMVQDLCLQRCARYEEIGGKAIPMPILAGPGRWAIPELEWDAPSVLAITRECLAFNIAPFFIDAGATSQ